MAFGNKEKTRALVIATAALSALGGCGRSESSIGTPVLETVAIAEGSCDAFEVRGPSDTRALWERRRDAVLGGCPEQNLPPFDPNAE